MASLLLRGRRPAPRNGAPFCLFMMATAMISSVGGYVNWSNPVKSGWNRWWGRGQDVAHLHLTSLIYVGETKTKTKTKQTNKKETRDRKWNDNDRYNERHTPWKLMNVPGEKKRGGGNGIKKYLNESKINRFSLPVALLDLYRSYRTGFYRFF